MKKTAEMGARAKKSKPRVKMKKPPGRAGGRVQKRGNCEGAGANKQKRELAGETAPAERGRRAHIFFGAPYWVRRIADT